ncbi:gas vesicle protein GvpG [Dactylosporangium siamense]|uniref:Gas vesicle protein n=1 Tax=Dactylosporangium siamense TaxID=685454 RepID=A0A919UAF6_9ACTN|nr:gas vesicle protein GvpG [Dactylosporangium siamense]GIG47967.1 gas vesicle protein [Dactylosporangium siamense]
MGLIGGIVTLPFAPVRVALWVGELIREQVEHELYDPAVIRGQIEQLDQDRSAGRIAPEEADRRQRELIARLVRPVGQPEPTTATGRRQEG